MHRVNRLAKHCCYLILASLPVGQAFAAGDRVITIDHVKHDEGAIIVKVDRYSRIGFELQNTCNQDVKIQVKGSPASMYPAAAAAPSAAVQCPGGQSLLAARDGTSEVDKSWFPVDRSMTFEVLVEPDPTKTLEVVIDKKATKLTPMRVLVTALVDDTSWETVFAGGFTISALTNPKYSLTPTTAGGTTYAIRQNKDSEDAASLGLVAFIHQMYKPTWIDGVGLSLGLGVDQQSGLSFFPGVSARFGDLFITAGSHLAQVNTLPGNFKVGDETTDVNAINTLGKRVDYSWFLSMSYKFLGNSSNFTVPQFQPAAPQH